jgi:hypothetical protein
MILWQVDVDEQLVGIEHLVGYHMAHTQNDNN